MSIKTLAGAWQYPRKRAFAPELYLADAKLLLRLTACKSLSTEVQQGFSLCTAAPPPMFDIYRIYQYNIPIYKNVYKVIALIKLKVFTVKSNYGENLDLFT